MIKHLVLLKFRPDAAPEAIEACFRELNGLRERVPGILDFCGGPYSSREGLNRGYTHGFVMTFESPEHRDAYLPHPAHQEVAARVVALLDGGIDGVVAFDFPA